LEIEVIQVGGFKLDRFIKMMNMYVRKTLARSSVHDWNDVQRVSDGVPKRHISMRTYNSYYKHFLAEEVREGDKALAKRMVVRNDALNYGVLVVACEGYVLRLWTFSKDRGCPVPGSVLNLDTFADVMEGRHFKNEKGGTTKEHKNLSRKSKHGVKFQTSNEKSESVRESLDEVQNLEEKFRAKFIQIIDKMIANGEHLEESEDDKNDDGELAGYFVDGRDRDDQEDVEVEVDEQPYFIGFEPTNFQGKKTIVDLVECDLSSDTVVDRPYAHMSLSPSVRSYIPLVMPINPDTTNDTETLSARGCKVEAMSFADGRSRCVITMVLGNGK
jgi:hypothetical protein